MKWKYVATLWLAIGIFGIALAAFAAAAPYAPTSLTVASSSSRDLTTQTAVSTNAQGGNVTELNIAALTITKSWQGYYGNVTGTVTLQDANSQTFYNWSATTFNARIFATRDNTVTWVGTNCTNATNRSSEETYLGQVPSDSDSVTNTFNKTTHPAFVVGTNNIIANTCFSTYGFVNNNTQSSNFVNLLLTSGSGQLIYTTLTNRTASGTAPVGFDGRQHDFEILVGENEKPGSLGVTPYFFWVEFT